MRWVGGTAPIEVIVNEFEPWVHELLAEVVPGALAENLRVPLWDHSAVHEPISVGADVLQGIAMGVTPHSSRTPAGHFILSSVCARAARSPSLEQFVRYVAGATEPSEAFEEVVGVEADSFARVHGRERERLIKELLDAAKVEQERVVQLRNCDVFVAEFRPSRARRHFGSECSLVPPPDR